MEPIQIVHHRDVRIILWLAIVVLAVLGPSALIAAESDNRAADLKLSPIWNETPFPARNLSISSNESTSGILKLEFRNVGLPPKPTLSAVSTNYFIAGAAEKVPEIEVTEVGYVRIRNGRIVESIATVPPNETGRSDLNAVADIVKSGVLRHLNVYALSLKVVLPVRSDTGDEFWLLDRLNVNIDIGPAPVLSDEEKIRSLSFRPENESRDLVDLQVLNPQIATAFYRTKPETPRLVDEDWRKRLESAIQSGGAFRLTVYNPGVYRLTYDDLNSAAKKIKRFVVPSDLTAFRLFRNGQEVPLFRGRADGSTSEEQRSLTFSVSADEAAAGEAVYWLLDAGEGTQGSAKVTSPPVEMKRVGTLSELQTPQAPTLVRKEIITAPTADYNPRLRGTYSRNRWFWKSIASNETAALPLSLPADFAPLTTSVVELTFAYGFTNPASSTPELELIINGSPDHVTSLSAVQGLASLTIPATLLKAGENQVAARLTYASSSNGPQPEVYIQSLKAAWVQYLKPISISETPFMVEESATSAGVWIAFPPSDADKRSSPGAILFSWRNGEPYLLTRKGTDAAVFRDFGDNRGPFFVADLDSAESPPKVEAVGSLLDLEHLGPANYVVIAPQKYHKAVEPLLERHRSNGLKTVLIEPKQVFDLFNYGERSANGIQHLLKYGFYNWGAPKLSYVLIVGEASDYRGDPKNLPSGAREDEVPVFNDGDFNAPRGDHQYALVAGDDTLVDLAVGRLPVASAEELTRVIEKMHLYEETSADGQEWTRIASYVYDDNEEFPRAVDFVVGQGNAPPGTVERVQQSDFPYVPNPRVGYRKRSHEATADLLGRFQRGMSVINFFGHGGPNLWSHERLMHLTDVPLLTNAPRLPFVTCASCDTAWLDFPVLPVKTSMGELLVTSPRGGAIGLFGPVAGASPHEHQILVSMLMEGLYRRQIRAMGDLTAYAKNNYYAERRSPSLPLQYVLVGDPALELNIPKIGPGVEITPTTVTAGQPWAVKVHLSAGLLNATTGTLTLRSLLDGEEVLSGTVRLMDSQGGRTATLRGRPLEPGPYSVEMTTGSADVIYADLLLAQQSPEISGAISDLSSTESARIDVLSSSFESRPLLSTHNQQLHLTLRNAAQTTIAELAASLTAPDGELIAQNTQREAIAPEDVRIVSLNSHQRLPLGKSSVTLELAGNVDGTTATLFTQSYPIEVAEPAGLEFVQGSARAESHSGKLVRGQTIFLRALLRNPGLIPAKNVVLRAKAGDPVSGDLLQTINDLFSVTIEELPPGENRLVTFRWEDTWKKLPNGTVYLVAESAGSTTPAAISVPMQQIEAAPNFSLENLAASTLTPQLGSTVTLSAMALEEGSTGRGPVEIEFGLYDFVSGESHNVRRTVTSLAQPTTVSTELFVDRPFTIAYATVNSAKEWDEATSSDNRVEIQLTPLVPLERDADASALELPLDGSLTTGMYTLAGQGMRLVSNFGRGDEVRVTSDMLSSGKVNKSGSVPDESRDDAWSIATGHIWAHESEDAGELDIKVDLGTAHHPETKYSVTALVAASLNVKDNKGGSFFTRLGDSEQFREVQFKPLSGSALAEVYVGNTGITSGVLSLSIRQTSSTEFHFYGIRVQALSGVLSSPAYLVETDLVGRAAKLSLNGTVTKQTARFEFRSGVLDGDWVHWSDWNATKWPDLPVRLDNQVFQWRSFVLPGSPRQPILRSVLLVTE